MIAAHKGIIRFGLLLLGIAVAGNFLLPHNASALSGADFNAGRIIDDGLFFSPNTMTSGDIQTFLNAKVPTCDTNGTQPYAGTTRAAYGTSKGYPPPYICLKDYSQTIPSKTSDAYCGGSITGGTESAAQIIFDVSQACGVSPKVLLVLLQKEQALVTDDWPWPIEYQSATGYGCPDTAACDSQYYGFFNQVYNAARQYQIYAKKPNLYNYEGGQTSYVQYNPDSSCGGSNISMQNQATAGLYNYTPYQPNQAALNNLYGSGDNCSAYGNRNFWRTYIDWFGTTYTNIPYAWSYEGQWAYSDATMTQTFTAVPTVTPGSKLYVKVKARNMGNQTWDQSFMRMGTYQAADRISQFADTSWLTVNRPAQLTESSLTPGQIGTFQFTLQAPTSPGTYIEHFNPVAENRTWLNDLDLSFTINVNSSIGPSNAVDTSLPSGATLNKASYLLSPDGQSTLALQRDGNLVLYSNFQPVWRTGILNSSINRLVMQGDGNLVLYNQNNQPVWDSETQNNPGAYLKLQSDGNMVIYSASSAPLWATSTLQNPDHLAYVNISLPYGSMLFPGQSIDTADRKYHLIMQRDGNLVLYSPNRALWATGTDGKSVSFLAMQTDGNLVLYDQSLHPLWASGTAGKGMLGLTIQQDGNLVLYNTAHKAFWNTGTQGQQ